MGVCQSCESFFLIATNEIEGLMYMNEQLNETDKQQIIKIFMNDGYGALKEN